MHNRAVHLTAMLAAAATTLMTFLEEAKAESVLLKPKFVQGRITYLELNEEIEHTIVSGVPSESPTKMTARQTFGVWHKVEAVSPAGITRIVLTYDRIRQVFEGPMGSRSFDSDADDPADTSNVLAMAMGPMLGMPMTMELDKDNNVTSFSGMEAVRKRIEETTGGGPIYNRIKAELDDDSYRMLWGESRLALYANKEVKVGDSWTRTLKQHDRALGELIFTYNCELKSLGTENGRKTATVAYTATVAQAPGSKPEPDPDGTVRRLDFGAFEGTALYDVERGEFVKQASEARIKISMTAPSAGDAGISGTLEQKIKSSLGVLTKTERQKQKLENQKKAAGGPDE
ncbi:MAG TPA: DUF6263 family protein [Phycisphaerae bacterium]|nr:DUF6263 family protein [Phycisphaerae bacterium]